MGYTFDENLREKPLSLVEMKQGIVLLKEHLHEGPLYGKNCGLIGVYERITGNLSDSKYYLQKAIEYYTQTDNIQSLLTNFASHIHIIGKEIFLLQIQSLPNFYKHCQTYPLMKIFSTNITKK